MLGLHIGTRQSQRATTLPRVGYQQHSTENSEEPDAYLQVTTAERFTPYLREMVPTWAEGGLIIMSS